MLSKKLRQREEESELLKVDMSNIEKERKGGGEYLNEDASTHIDSVLRGVGDGILDATPEPLLDLRNRWSTQQTLPHWWT